MLRPCSFKTGLQLVTVWTSVICVSISAANASPSPSIKSSKTVGKADVKAMPDEAVGLQKYRDALRSGKLLAVKKVVLKQLALIQKSNSPAQLDARVRWQLRVVEVLTRIGEYDLASSYLRAAKSELGQIKTSKISTVRPEITSAQDSPNAFSNPVSSNSVPSNPVPSNFVPSNLVQSNPQIQFVFDSLYLNASSYKIADALRDLQTLNNDVLASPSTSDSQKSAFMEAAAFIDYQNGYWQKSVDEYNQAASFLSTNNSDTASSGNSANAESGISKPTQVMSDDIARIRTRLAQSLIETGQLLPAAIAIDSVLDYYRIAHREEDIGNLEALLVSAHLSRIKEQFTRAGRISKSLKFAAEQNAGLGSTLAIQASLELAQALAYGFRSAEASEEFKDVIKRCKSRNLQDPLLIESHVVMARMLSLSDDPEGTGKELQEMAPAFKALPGAHPFRISATLAAAFALERNKSLDEADKTYQQVINAVSSQYGEDSPNLLSPLFEYYRFALMNSRSNVLSAQRKLTELEKKLLPPNHPLIVRTYELIAAEMLNSGFYDGAENLYAFVKLIRYQNKSEVFRMPGITLGAAIGERFLSSTDISGMKPIPASQLELWRTGLKKCESGNWNGAKTDFLTCIESEEKSLSPDNDAIADMYIRLACLAHTYNNSEKVMGWYAKALKILTDKYGADDARVDDLKVMMCLDFESKGRWGRSLALDAYNGWFKYLTKQPAPEFAPSNSSSININKPVPVERFESDQEYYKYCATSLVNVAQILGSYNMREEALSASFLSLSALRKCPHLDDKNVFDIALALNDSFLQLADLVDSREVLDIAISTAKSMNSPDLLSLAKLKLCDTLLREGDLESASSSLEDSVISGDSFQSSLNRAYTLHLQSLVAEERENYENSLKAEISAKAIYESLCPKTQFEFDESSVRVIALSLRLNKMDSKSAEQKLYALFNKYLESHDSKNRLLLASIYGTMFDVQLKSTHLHDAEMFGQRALEIWHAEPSMFNMEISQRLALADLYYKMKQPDHAYSDAWEAAFEAGKYIEKSLPNLSMVEQLKFTSKLDKIVDVLYSYANATKNFSLAYEVSYAWQGMVVDLQKPRALRLNLFKNKNSSTAADLISTSSRIADIARNLEDGSPLTKELAAELTDASAKKEQLERKLSTEQYTFSSLNVGVLRYFQSLLNADEAFLQMTEFSDHTDGDKRKYMFVLVGREFEPLWIGPFDKSVIDANVHNWLVSIEAVPGELVSGDRNLTADDDDVAPVPAAKSTVSKTDAEERAWKFFETTIRDRIKQSLPKQVSKLWVCPNGSLIRMPWFRLFVAKGFEVSQVASVRELIRAKGVSGFKNPKPNILIIGNLNYYPKDGRPLVNTKSEVEDVKAAAGDFAGPPLEGDDADRPTLLKNLSEKSIVHIASHGYFNDPLVASRRKLADSYVARRDSLFERNPLVLSGIVGSATKDANGKSGSGKVSAEELLAVPMNGCELVTLSACETGLGTLSVSQGVLGLRSALHAAGAQSILMSLWTVPDNSTAMLMQQFYQNYLLNKFSKSESLRLAQEKVAQAFPGARNWAGWVISGSAWSAKEHTLPAK